MSSSLNNMDSQGYDVPTSGWVDANSGDGYTPKGVASRSTVVRGDGVKYAVSASTGSYQTATVSTPETRKRDRLRRLNKRFRTLSNAY